MRGLTGSLEEEMVVKLKHRRQRALWQGCHRHGRADGGRAATASAARRRDQSRM